MRHSARIIAAVLAAAHLIPVSAQGSTWCGKNFMPNQTVVPPGGQFPLPPASTEPLVAFRCSPAFRPYLEEDGDNAIILIDAPIVYQYIQGASPILLSNSSQSEGGDLGTLNVTVSIDGIVFAQGGVPVNATGYEVSVNISSLVPQRTQYTITCGATYTPETSQPSTQQFFAEASLLYLPNSNSSVVKMDSRTGALWTRSLNESSGQFRPFIPQGFYISFDTYLESNLTFIDQLKAQGFNTLHPIPPYNNATAFQQVLNRAIELELYVVFDVRSIYQNLTAVAQQIVAYSTYPNLLLWETAHEPDGTSDPLNAARDTYDLIYSLDGYHPVSIVLNCQDYNFSPYVEGADIVIEDAYPIGINATFSPVWLAPCTPDFGHCGCDDCEGSIYDITARIQTFKDRLNILGYDRTKTVWTTPQAFGSEVYWNTTPTGQQWTAMQVTSFSHGATGAMSFQYPTTSGNLTTIEGTAVALTPIIADIIQPFIVDGNATHETYDVWGVDIGVWNNGTTYLFLGTNFNSSQVFVPWASAGLNGVTTNATTQVQRILSVGQNTNTSGFNFMSGGVGIYTATPPN